YDQFDGRAKQRWGRIPGIRLADHVVVCDWTGIDTCQFCSNHSATKYSRDLHLQLVHGGGHHFYHRDNVGCLLTFLAKGARGDDCSGLLHASGSWDVVYAVHLGDCLLLLTSTIKQTDLFL